MFGDERGGATNVRFGLKPMKNAEAQDQYYEEARKVVRDLNSRYLRARLPELDLPEANDALGRLEQGETVQGVKPEDLLYLPHKDYFRRRGVPAFHRTGAQGESFDALDAYLEHLRRTLPESYLAAIDFKEFVEQLRKVEAGELTAEEASRQLPTLRRIAGSCPCSKSVRWVVETPAAGNGGNGHPAAG
jgi:hypothetical protein